MPSYDENQPLVLLEAMAAVVPAVAYAAGRGTPPSPRRTRLVGPIGDRARLAVNPARLIDDEEERQRLARACWKRQKSCRAGWRPARAETLDRLLGRSSGHVSVSAARAGAVFHETRKEGLLGARRRRATACAFLGGKRRPIPRNADPRRAVFELEVRREIVVPDRRSSCEARAAARRRPHQRPDVPAASELVMRR